MQVCSGKDFHEFEVLLWDLKRFLKMFHGLSRVSESFLGFHCKFTKVPLRAIQMILGEGSPEFQDSDFLVDVKIIPQDLPKSLRMLRDLGVVEIV